MTQESTLAHPLAEWINQVDTVVAALQDQYVALGRLIFIAGTTLSYSDRKRALSHLRIVGVSISDQRAALAAYLFENPDEGADEDLRIDPRLVFAGCRNNKMLNTTKEDQGRLLSGEPLAIVTPKNEVVKRPWQDMKAYERNQLVARNGAIRDVEAQRQKPKVPKPQPMIGAVETITLEGDLLTFRATTASLSCAVADFVEMLGMDNLQRLANWRLKDSA